jgi:hypothetical protein
VRKIPTIVLLILTAFVVPASAQVPPLKKGERAVFLTVARLTLYCGDWNAAHPGGREPRADSNAMIKVSEEQITNGIACDLYILGVHDGRLDAGSPAHYHPVGVYLDYMKPMVDTFLKYSKDHPERQDFAASTVLGEVEAIITKAQTGH